MKKMKTKKRIVIHPHGVIEVESMGIETSGLTLREASEAQLIYATAPFDDRVFVLKNRWGKRGFVSTNELKEYKIRAKEYSGRQD